jgi:hypothetical protein
MYPGPRIAERVYPVSRMVDQTYEWPSPVCEAAGFCSEKDLRCVEDHLNPWAWLGMATDASVAEADLGHAPHDPKQRWCYCLLSLEMTPMLVLVSILEASIA